MNIMVHDQKGKPDAALEPVKAQRRAKPRMGSGKKLEQDLNEPAKGARRAGKGPERVLETWEATCSCCGQKFESLIEPKDKSRPLYGPCCLERHERGTQTF